jgi:hypothetical protein
MANGNGITSEQVVKAIEGSGGFVTQIGKRLGCSPRHVYRLLEKYQTAKDALFNERESMKDMAEGEMYKKIKGGDTTMIIFYLKTQAKDRGYVERKEWSGTDDAPPIKQEITLDLSALTLDQLAALAAWDGEGSGAK